MSQSRFVFVVFCFTAVLIFAVYLRSANDRIFYELCAHYAEQSRLKQELGTKQLLLESLINPAAISQRVDESNTED
ncbi:MAG TPA: hypothetical protein DIU00_22630 [Phycisphaerales bacterium]|nr:hypothetical protein [Phycisphaerales bacterium]